MAERRLTGSGSIVIRGSTAVVRAALLDTGVLTDAIPGAVRVEVSCGGRYAADLSLGVGPFRSRYRAELRIADGDAPGVLTLSGSSTGGFGRGHATGCVVLVEMDDERTRVDWRYAGSVSGPVTFAGGAVLRVASDLFVSRFFTTVSRTVPGALLQDQRATEAK